MFYSKQATTGRRRIIQLSRKKKPSCPGRDWNPAHPVTAVFAPDHVKVPLLPALTSGHSHGLIEAWFCVCSPQTGKVQLCTQSPQTDRRMLLVCEIQMTVHKLNCWRSSHTNAWSLVNCQEQQSDHQQAYLKFVD